MEKDDDAAKRAARQLASNLNRAEKGSALSMIDAERRAREEKSRRLRDLRLAQPAPEPVEAPKRKRAPAKKAVKKAS